MEQKDNMHSNRQRTLPSSAAAGALCWAALIFNGNAEPTGTTLADAIIPITEATTEKQVKVVFDKVCATCHGETGVGKVDLGAPSIAGMPAWYVAIQLEKFRTGVRGGHPKDLEGTQMRVMANALRLEWIKALSEHIAAMKSKPTENTLGGDADGARDYYEQTCMACHRFNGQGEKVFRSAPLTTLSDWYIAKTLRKYRQGFRGTDPIEDNDAFKMHEQAKLLSDKAIADMAAYIAELAETYPPGKRKGRVRR